MDKLDADIGGLLEGLGIAQHKLQIVNEGKGTVLRLMIKRADGTMDLDTCEKVSTAVSQWLDEHPASDKAYQLDVCSFGAEAPLDGLAEVQAAVGRYIHVKFDGGYQGYDELDGELKACDAEKLMLGYSVKGIAKTMEIPHGRIASVRLAVKV